MMYSDGVFKSQSRNIFQGWRDSFIKLTFLFVYLRLYCTELFTSPGLKGSQQKQQREGIGGTGGMGGGAKNSPASRAGRGASGRGQWHTPPPSDGWRVNHPDGGGNGDDSSPRRRGEIRINGKGEHGTFKRQGGGN